jgi:hypothetical protein
MGEVYSFLELAPFKHMFICNYSSITIPIMKCPEEATFQWTKEAEKAFKQIKTVMNQGKNGPPKNKKDKHESYLIPKI